MRFALVIFDCDGVLVDSEPIANRIFAEELAAIGLALEFDDVVKRFVGRTMASCIAEIERDLGDRCPTASSTDCSRGRFVPSSKISNRCPGSSKRSRRSTARPASHRAATRRSCA